MLNPASVYDEPLTREDVVGSKMVADPLRIAHCSRSIDGGSAFVVSAVEGTDTHPKPPIYVIGTGTRFHHYYMGSYPDLTDTVYELASASIAEAMEEAGLGLGDVDVMYPYDGFAIMPLLILEAAGFAPRGGAVEMYEAGAPAPGGSLPCNTHGGSLNHGLPAFPAVLFLLTEAVRQLRGEAGKRQVPEARNALIHAWSGLGGVNASFVLSGDAA
jgi:acetyl-CoA acetyltransferase